MISTHSATYHPSRRGLAMTYSYTRPLPRVLGVVATTRLQPRRRDLAIAGLSRALKAVKALFVG
jgi:hypothetical protein